jgi:hypothetical protein
MILLCFLIVLFDMYITLDKYHLVLSIVKFKNLAIFVFLYFLYYDLTNIY